MPDGAWTLVVCKTVTVLQDFKGLSIDKLEKYFLVLAALDENLAEYKDIKNDLEQVKCTTRHIYKSSNDIWQGRHLGIVHCVVAYLCHYIFCCRFLPVLSTKKLAANHLHTMH